MSYSILRFDAPSDFLDHSASWLLQNEAENNLILSLGHRLCQSTAGYDPPIYLAAVEHDHRVVGCALRTPQFKLLVTQLPGAAVPVLIHDVASFYDAIPAVLGPDQVARTCARLWAQLHGLSTHVGTRQRIYSLERILPLRAPVPGELRPANAADLDIATRWIEQFSSDSSVSMTRARTLVEDRIERRQLFFWIDQGEHRSMAAWAGITPHGVRIGYVYTPREWRGRGYASACTAAVSQRALDAGYRFCFLYTDLANPTSNAIYQRLGYTPVADVADWVIA